MTAKRWAGTTVRKARTYWQSRLPLPCWRCGRVLTPGSRWTVGHIVDRALGGSHTDPANQWPECARCNYSAGGKLGAAITNARRPIAEERRDSERARGIRGW